MKKKLLISLLILVIAVVLFYLYWLVAAPIVSLYFLKSPDCIVRGVDYYLDGTYLNYENGKDFEKLLSDFQVTSENHVIDFYYVDNYIEDNPIHGKMCDIYALDVAYPQDIYEQIKNNVLARAARHQISGEFTSYALPYDPMYGEIVEVVSFCDKAYVVRYIIITEFDTTDGFDGVFRMHTNLDWDHVDGLKSLAQ